MHFYQDFHGKKESHYNFLACNVSSYAILTASFSAVSADLYCDCGISDWSHFYAGCIYCVLQQNHGTYFKKIYDSRDACKVGRR